MSAQARTYQWRRQTIAETYDRIVREPAFPWVAIGDFLDDWRRSEPEDRQELVQDGLAEHEQTRNLQRWFVTISFASSPAKDVVVSVTMPATWLRMLPNQRDWRRLGRPYTARARAELVTSLEDASDAA